MRPLAVHASEEPNVLEVIWNFIAASSLQARLFGFQKYSFCEEFQLDIEEKDTQSVCSCKLEATPRCGCLQAHLANLQDVTGFVQNIFVFVLEMFVAMRSQKMLNHTNTWGWKIPPNFKGTCKKDEAFSKCSTVTCPGVHQTKAAFRPMWDCPSASSKKYVLLAERRVKDTKVWKQTRDKIPVLRCVETNLRFSVCPHWCENNLWRRISKLIRSTTSFVWS